MKKKTIVEIIALFFVILFLYTSISKLMEVDVAREQIALTPLLQPVAGFVVIALPVAEIVAAVLLFLPATRKWGLYAGLGLMVCFTGYVLYILSYNKELPCTCGGVLQSMSWPQHLIFNIVCVGLLGTAIWLRRRAVVGLREDTAMMVRGSHV